MYNRITHLQFAQTLQKEKPGTKFGQAVWLAAMELWPHMAKHYKDSDFDLRLNSATASFSEDHIEKFIQALEKAIEAERLATN